MEQNGFINNKNNDYCHEYLGIIIEDLHEENVLTSNEIIYFIDTVIYIK
jgi:Serine/Threonine/Tyrosine Kinase found in polyvalent proteins